MTPQHLCASEHHSGTTFGPPHVTDDSGHRRRSGGGIPCHEAIVSATAKTARDLCTDRLAHRECTGAGPDHRGRTDAQHPSSATPNPHFPGASIIRPRG